MSAVARFFFLVRPEGFSADHPVGSIGLLRVDENVLLLLDRRLRPMVGDASWGYALNRTR